MTHLYGNGVRVGFVRAGRYIVRGDLLNRKLNLHRKITLPFQRQHFEGTGSWSVVVKDLEGGAGSIGATNGTWVPSRGCYDTG